MALNGSVVTSSYDGRYYQLEWTASQSITGNYSDISWILYSFGGNHNWYAERALDVVINGEYVLSKSEYVTRYTGQISSGTKRIHHNNNGEASFSVSIRAAVYYSTVNCTGSNSFVLNNIPRASTFTVSSTSVKTGDTITININKNVSSYRHEVYYVTPDGYGYTNGLSQSWQVDTSCTFTPIASVIAPKTPNSRTINLKIVVKTYSGDTRIGDYSALTITVTIDDSVKPTLSLNVGDQYGYDQIYGKMISTLSCFSAAIVDESGVYGSTISKYTITMNGKTYNSKYAVSEPIQSEKYNVVTATVTDSRGITSDPVSLTLDVMSYFNPKINSFEVRRCDENGNSDDEGLYAKITYNLDIAPLENNNEKIAKLLYKPINVEDYIEQEIQLTDYSQYGNIILSDISDVLSYNFCLEIKDHFNSATKSVVISTAATPMDFGMRGKGINIGKVCTKEGLTVSWESEFEKPSNFLDDIKFKGNSILHSYLVSSGNVDCIYQSNNEICSIDITEPGIYIALGCVSSSVSTSSSIVSAYFTPGDDNCVKVTSNTSRTTMIAGGGCCVWDIIKAVDKTSISLDSYGYYDSSYKLKGTMSIIKIL